MTPWREALARELTYIDTGRYVCELPYRLLLMAGVVKLLWPGAPWWFLVACGPLVITSMARIGRWYKTHGWMRQSNVVSVVEGLSPLAIIQYEWLYRICVALGVSSSVGTQPSAQVAQAIREACREPAP